MHFDYATMRVVVPDHVVSRLVDGSTVLLDIDTGRSFSFDDVGTKAWQALTTSPSVLAALSHLRSEYDAAPDVIEQDLLQMLEQLAANNLVRLETR
jgi:hypothetical protein